MKTGFIGLGRLGRAMAERLIDGGIELAVWNRSKEKAEGLSARVAPDPAGLVSGVEVLFLSLTGSEAVEAVLAGPGGVLEGDCRGRMVVDTTTNRADAARHFRDLLRERGAAYLEAPVIGSVVPALQGNLVMLVSGDRKPFDLARPLLDKLARTVVFMGEPGRATAMKLLNNLVLATLMAGIGEALALGEAAGITRGTALEVLGAGAGSSALLSAKREKLLRRDWESHFTAALLYKDLHYLQDLARELGRPLFTGGLVKELYAQAFPRGMGDLDFSVIAEVLRGPTTPREDRG